MFGSKKTSQNQTPSQYAEYIHTMQDDISSGNLAIDQKDLAVKIEAADHIVDQLGSLSQNSPKNTPQQANELHAASNSPFLSDQQKTIENREPAPVAQMPLPKESLTTNTTAPKEQSHLIPIEKLRTPSQQINWYRITIGAVSFLIIVVAGFAGYYFFMTRKTTPSISEKPIEESTQQISINPTLEKFSAENPNYLSIDMSTASAETIQKKLSEIATEILETKSTSIFEFIITDSNNNPVAFPIFAIAAKFGLSEDVLQELEENFSLFIYNEEGKVHIGLATAVNDENFIKTELLKREKTLASDLAPLMLGEKPQTTDGEFKNGSYGAISTRYKNFNQEETLSIDYTITSKTLFVATSKNTLRAIIDKYTKSSVQKNSSDKQ